MVMGALDVDVTDALVQVQVLVLVLVQVQVLVRACGFAAGLTAGQLAWQVVERRVSLASPHWLGLGTAGPAR